MSFNVSACVAHRRNVKVRVAHASTTTTTTTIQSSDSTILYGTDAWRWWLFLCIEREKMKASTFLCVKCFWLISMEKPSNKIAICTENMFYSFAYLMMRAKWFIDHIDSYSPRSITNWLYYYIYVFLLTDSVRFVHSDCRTCPTKRPPLTECHAVASSISNGWCRIYRINRKIVST